MKHLDRYLYGLKSEKLIKVAIEAVDSRGDDDYGIFDASFQFANSIRDANTGVKF